MSQQQQQPQQDDERQQQPTPQQQQQQQQRSQPIAPRHHSSGTTGFVYNSRRQPVSWFDRIDTLTGIVVFVAGLYSVRSIFRHRAQLRLAAQHLHSQQATADQRYAHTAAEERWRAAERAFHEDELRRLRAQQQWQYAARARATKAQTDYLYRQAKSSPHYQSWGSTQPPPDEQQQHSERHRQRANAQQRMQQEQQQWWQRQQQSSTSSGSRQQNFGGATEEQRQQVSARIALGLMDESQVAKFASMRDVALLLEKPPLLEADVKAAFKKCALRDHPDMPGGSADKFRKVAMAYDAIMKHLNHKQPAS